MIGGGKVTVSISVEVDEIPELEFLRLEADDGEIELRFDCVVDDYVPAQITGPVESSHPAEGGAAYVDRVYLMRDGRRIELPIALAEIFDDEIQEMASQELEDKIASIEEDMWDARRERS